METLAKTALHYGATLVGHSLLGPWGGFFGGVLADSLTEILPEPIQEHANKLIESASEKLAESALGEPLKQLGDSLKNRSPRLESLCRKALADALVATQSTLPNELREDTESWFLNWQLALKIPLDEELTKAPATSEEYLATFLGATLERLDDIGQRRLKNNISITPSKHTRSIPIRLVQVLQHQLPEALKTSYKLLITQPENAQALNEAVLAYYDWLGSKIVLLESQTTPIPEIARVLQAMKAQLDRIEAQGIPGLVHGNEKLGKQPTSPKESIQRIGPRQSEPSVGPRIIRPNDWIVGTQLAKATEGLADTAWTTQFHQYTESLLVSDFHKRRHEIVVEIVKKYELRPTREEQTEFEKLNRLRKNQGRLEMFPSTRFRLLSMPRFRGGKVFIDVAAFDFVTFSVIRDSNDDKLVSRSLERIRQVSPERVRNCANADSSTNVYGEIPFVPMGIEMVLITSDNKCLLRQRGQSVQTEPRKWDVSVSGSLGEAHRMSGSKNVLDMSRVSADLAREEVGTLRGNPAEVDFIGLHINYTTGATDLLASWRLEATEKELRQHLKPGTKGPETFPTKVSAQQPFSSDTNNRIIGWTEAECLSAVSSIHGSGDRFIPEALFCLIRALQFR